MVGQTVKISVHKRTKAFKYLEKIVFSVLSRNIKKGTVTLKVESHPSFSIRHAQCDIGNNITSNFHQMSSRNLFKYAKDELKGMVYKFKLRDVFYPVTVY